MRGAAAKDFRRQASKVANQTLDVMRPPVEAAIRNEQVTRMRVATLEAKTDAMAEGVTRLGDFVARNLRGRLRWLLLGR